ncbi:MAG: hypothetical protein OXF93_17025 [Acidobacteria bacterium]|nr:hypothetical protein [Acidobacteriota bacterium]
MDIVVSRTEPGSIAAIGKWASPVAERVRQARQTVPTRGLIVKRHGRAARSIGRRTVPLTVGER